MLQLTIRGPLRRADLPGLFARVCALLEESDPTVISCDVTNIAADAVAVDALARLQLAAQRHGAGIQLLGASEELYALVSFMGLGGVLPAGSTRPGGEGGRTAGTTLRWRGRT